MRFCCVRFGNVLGTRGSLVPTIRKQIKAGGPVTITQPKMTRFMMSLDEAVGLCLEAAKMCEGGEIFALKMPSLWVSDLIEAMIEELAPSFGHDPDGVVRRLIGERPGEKMGERLLDDEEVHRTSELEKMLVVYPPRLWQKLKQPPPKIDPGLYDSDIATQLDREAVHDMLQKAGVI